MVGALEQTGLAADQVMVSMPGGVLPMADAADNLVVLAGLGVQTAIDDFGLGPLGFGLLASDLPVQAVRVARGLVETRSPYVAALLPLVREQGVAVAVDGIDSAEQAVWWRDAGAHFATGDHFGVAGTAGDFLKRLEPR